MLCAQLALPLTQAGEEEMGELCLLAASLKTASNCWLGIGLCTETPLCTVHSGFLHCCCRFALVVKEYVAVWKRIEWDLPVLEISFGRSCFLKLMDGLVGI